MPAHVSYPGVYVQEGGGEVRTPTGVTTSVTAFVDFFARGPMNQPVRVTGMADFHRLFGGLHAYSESAYAMQQYFDNGGRSAWLVRIAKGAAHAGVELASAPAGPVVLEVRALNEGAWGNGLRVEIDYPASGARDRFDLTVSLFETRNGLAVPDTSEIFRDLSMVKTDRRYVEKVINDAGSGSQLLRVRAIGSARPMQSGTMSGPLANFPALASATPELLVRIGTGAAPIEGIARLSTRPASLEQARDALQAAIRAARPTWPSFAQAVLAIREGSLCVKSGPVEAMAQPEFVASPNDATAARLGLLAGSRLQGCFSKDLSSLAWSAIGQGTLDVSDGVHSEAIAIDAAPSSAAAFAASLEQKLRGIHHPTLRAIFAAARVLSYTDGAGSMHLLVAAGAPGATYFFSNTTDPASTLAGDLQLLPGGAVLLGTPISALSPGGIAAGSTLGVKLVCGANTLEATVLLAAAGTPAQVANALQAGLRGLNGFGSFSVAARTAAAVFELLVFCDPLPAGVVTFSACASDATSASQLGLDGAHACCNVRQYTLGSTAPFAAQAGGAAGTDGVPPTAAELIGDAADGTGLYALDRVDLFNILCLPATAVKTGPCALSDAQASDVLGAALSYCERRRAFLIIDTPNNVHTSEELRQWLAANSHLRHSNAALYFPRVQVPDPLDGLRLRSLGASGAVAGLYARTDAAQGVWKAPAGTQAAIHGIAGLTPMVSDADYGSLNPLGINCLRNLRLTGPVCWGARTTAGTDPSAPEWKYIPVRRLALFLEESLYRGMQWTVFERNDEALWAHIRLVIGSFLQGLFTQGALAGPAPHDAYFVKCDGETTSPSDINLCRVNVLVGFAPTRPAEFVILRIQLATAGP